MFWERFEAMCDKNKIKPNPFCKSIGIASGTVTSWKSGKIPNGENLIKISKHLNCSIDYLLGRTDNPNINNTNTNTEAKNNINIQLNQDDLEILNLIEKLPLKKRVKFISMLYHELDEK